MKNLKKRHGSLALLLVATFFFSSISAVAQSAPPQLPDPEKVGATKSDSPLGVSYLKQRYKISDEEARTRLELEDEVIALATKLRADGDPMFGGVWIEHEPVYRIVVAFADQDDRKALRESLSPKLRRYVQIKSVKRSEKQTSEAVDNIIAALNASKIEYVSGYNVKNDKFFVEVESNDVANQVRALIPPNLKGDVDVQVRKLPKGAAAPVGVQPGDDIQAGHWYYSSATSGAEECTFGFNVKYGATPGILTAGHCNGGVQAGTGQYWHYRNGHWIRLPSPTIARWAYGTKYDYQFHETTGYTQGAWVYYKNSQNKAGYPAEGFFKVVGTIGYMSQTVGMVLCKSGRITGLSCGEITHGWYTYNGAKGWILIEKSTEPRIADAGDSGSAIFRPPSSTGNVIAAGSATAADHGCIGPACRLVNMPIDYIDDEIPITVVLATP